MKIRQALYRRRLRLSGAAASVQESAFVLYFLAWGIKHRNYALSFSKMMNAPLDSNIHTQYFPSV